MSGNLQLYDNPSKNLFYNTFLHVATVLSLLSNGTLIALIVKSKRSDFGAYRYLLLTFAAADIYYGLVHFLIQPIPEAWSNVCYMAAHGYITGRQAVCLYASAHSHSYVVLVFHFLYRLLVIKGSPRYELFSKPWFFCFIFGCCAAVGFSWFTVMYWLYDTDEFVVEYMQPILREHTIASSRDVDQYSIAVFWKYGFLDGPRWSPIAGIVVMSSTMVGCYSFMVYAAVAIVRLMKENASTRSEKTNDLTRQLMRALMYQTLLPLATAYSPPLVSILVPFFGLHFPYISDLHPLFCGIHPIIDGCVLTYTIKQYRKMLISWFRCSKQTTTTIPSSALVVSNVSSHLP